MRPLLLSAMFCAVAGATPVTLGQFSFCRNVTCTPLAQSIATAPTILLHTVPTHGTGEWQFSLFNPIYPQPGPCCTMDVTLAWDIGSASRTVGGGGSNNHLSFGMSIPVPQVGTGLRDYKPHIVELQIQIRDALGVVVDSTSGNYFALMEVPEPATWPLVLAGLAILRRLKPINAPLD